MYMYLSIRESEITNTTQWWSYLHIIDHNHCMHKTVLNTDILNQLFTCSSTELVHVVRAGVCVPAGLSHRDQAYYQFRVAGSQTSEGWPVWCATTRRVVRKIWWITGLSAWSWCLTKSWNRSSWFPSWSTYRTTKGLGLGKAAPARPWFLFMARLPT